MFKKIDRWMSPNLGREMPVVRYGESGAPLLFFPTAAADYLEYERFRLIDAISRYIDAGLIRAYSIDSINKDAWLNEEVAPPERAHRQVLYDRYVRDELIPFIRSECGDQGVVTTGASFGAFHAMNTQCKHPDVVSGTIAMSGCYDIRSSCDGYHDENVYYNNPIEFVANLSDGRILDDLRGARITIVTGQGDYENPEYSKAMAAVLESKGVSVHLDLWGHDVKHDWPWWNRMLEHFIPLYFA